MIVLEIPPNPNCEAVEMRLFHDLEAPRPVTRVRLERTPGQPEWCLVTGWTLEHAPCEAVARKVDDSGEGVTTLVSGGGAGLRLQSGDRAGTVLAGEGVSPAAGLATGQPIPWRLDDPRQWGAPFLLLGDPLDLA